MRAVRSTPKKVYPLSRRPESSSPIDVSQVVEIQKAVKLFGGAELHLSTQVSGASNDHFPEESQYFEYS